MNTMNTMKITITLLIINLVFASYCYCEDLKFEKKEIIFDQNRKRIGIIEKYTNTEAGLLVFDQHYKLDTLIKFNNKSKNILLYANSIKGYSIIINSKKIFLLNLYKEQYDGFSIILYTDEELNFLGYLENNKTLKKILNDYMKKDLKEPIIKRLKWHDYFLGEFIEDIDKWFNKGVIIKTKTWEMEKWTEATKYRLYYEFKNGEFVLDLSLRQEVKRKAP